ncbi:hypothetical protein HQ524_01630 [Candidatus Uhrbacteria bacterium]|nr:hypothetical protein [Candidatus Uhrbacteria bacterium]
METLLSLLGDRDFHPRAMQGFEVNPGVVSGLMGALVRGDVTVGDVLKLRNRRCVPEHSEVAARLQEFYDGADWSNVRRVLKFDDEDTGHHLTVFDPWRMAQATRGEMKFTDADLELLKKMPFTEKVLASMGPNHGAMLFCIPQEQPVTMSDLFRWFGNDVALASPAISVGKIPLRGDPMHDEWSTRLTPGWHLVSFYMLRGGSAFEVDGILPSDGSESWATLAQTVLYALLQFRLENRVRKSVHDFEFICRTDGEDRELSVGSHVDNTGRLALSVTSVPDTWGDIIDTRSLVSHEWGY